MGVEAVCWCCGRAGRDLGPTGSAIARLNGTLKAPPPSQPSPSKGEGEEKRAIGLYFSRIGEMKGIPEFQVRNIAFNLCEIGRIALCMSIYGAISSLSPRGNTVRSMSAATMAPCTYTSGHSACACV